MRCCGSVRSWLAPLAHPSHSSTATRSPHPPPTTTRHHPRPVDRDVHAPRSSVVLLHGLFGFDTIGPFPPFQLHYWRGIREALSDLGCKVWVARVPAASSIRDRAHHLHHWLRKMVCGEDIVLVGHSMGGLDARYLVSRIRPHTLKEGGYRVRAVVTVCTPHRGSPFMDWCRDHIGLGASGGASVAAQVALGADRSARTSRDDAMERHDHPPEEMNGTAKSLPEDITLISPYLTTTLHRLYPLLPLLRTLDQPAYRNLVTNYLVERFNPNTPNVSDIIYHSYAAYVRRMSPIHPLRVPWEVVTAKEGDNDGLVSLTSATWGKLMGVFEADHWEMNKGITLPMQHGGRIGEGFDAISVYISAVSELYKAGC